MNTSLNSYAANNLSLDGTRILVVEDSDEARYSLASFLTRRHCDVVMATNGQEGLHLFKQHRPDIIITDIRMPVMDGLQMGREIRALDAEIPIIFLSAYSDEVYLKQSITLQVIQYIVKPVNLDKLMFALQSAIEKIQFRRNVNQTLKQLNETVNQYQSEAQRLQCYVQSIVGNDQHMDVNVVSQAKESISGDFYGIKQVGGDLYVLLGDGMGHGLSAILPALDLPKRFRQLAERGFGLNRIASELNQLVYEQHLAGHFVAATLIKLNVEQQQIEVLNCGNPPTLLTDLSGNVLHDFSSNHFAWGIANHEDFVPDVQTYHYQADFKLYAFSDGLSETLEHLHEQPGLSLVSDMLARQSLDEIAGWLRDLTDHQRHDDVTLLEIHASPQLTASGANPKPIVQADQLTPLTTLSDLSVLYVEDDPFALQSLARFLTRRVGAVLTANNGKEGLRLFERYRPKLVISDVAIPLLNGLQMVDAIRDIDPHVMIILITGDKAWLQNKDQLDALLEFSVSKVLSKPLNSRKLLEAIEQSCREHDYLHGLQLSASILMNSPLATFVTDAQRNIIAINPAFSEITGYSQKDVLGCNPRILSSGHHDAEFYRHMWQSIDQTGRWCGEIWNRRKNGEMFLEWVNITTIKDSSQQIRYYAAIFSDITQRAQAEEKFRHLAHHDALTGLPNRILFFDRLNHALLQAAREKTQLALIYLDIDHFKTINDTLGHGAGDELICALAQALTIAVRESDTVSRLGGDEFAIVLSGVGSAEMAGRLVMKIFNAVSRDYLINGKALRINVSMGIAMYPADGDDAETLIKRADNAMYQAKKRGRAGYQFFSFALERRAERHMAIQQGLHKALDQGELYIQYQPKFSSEQQRIVGAEALLRWNSPELGLVAPSEFIPIAEETGFIINISHWVMGQVCQDLADWQRLGIDVVPVAINISPSHFHRGNLLRCLKLHLERHRLSSRLLLVELTEGVVMNDKQQTLNQLLAIKDLGIAISIDDFGTGYSSLSYLRQLPIDELKIDRSFITEITDEASLDDSRLTAIPSAIIALADKLKMRLVAEGVETTVQRDFLQQNGCSIFQGYLFSKPVEKETLASLLKQNRIDCGESLSCVDDLIEVA